MSSPLYFPTEFRLAEARFCAQLVATAYDIYEQWHTHHPSSFTWSPNGPALTYSAPIFGQAAGLFIHHPEPFAFVAHNNQGHAYVVFRGTKNSHDWLSDAESHQDHTTLTQTPTLAHHGFLALYLSLQEALLQALKSVTALKQLTITGHSLGSALSTLSALDIKRALPVPIVHYNFASPRVGNPPFAQCYDDLNLPTFRIVNSEDLVPQVPPAAVGRALYQHVGTAVSFSANNGGVAANHSMAETYTYAIEHPEAPMQYQTTTAT